MARSERLGGWFKPRSYPHLDRPLSFESAEALVTDPAAIAAHGFLPLVGYTDEKRQFRTDKSDLSIPRSKRARIVTAKNRDIRYPSHTDSAIYAFYASRLQRVYEDWLLQKGLQDAVIGYRAGLGSNVDMAAEVFANVVARGDTTAMCFDISNFFPSIGHEQLKAALEEVLDLSPPPLDWYKVFRAITKFSWVMLPDLAKLFGFDEHDAPRPLVPSVPKAMQKIRKEKQIHVNKASVEIPQGTPISAVLANVSMNTFDVIIQAWAARHDAIYRRYSDDILLLISPDKEAEASTLIAETSANTGVGLEINPAKTEVSRFVRLGNGIHVDRPLTYLGFTFDGRTVTLRARTLSRYYRRMTYAVRGTVRGAKQAGKLAAQAHRRTIYRELSHLGSNNFYQYAKRADAKFPKSSVKRQLRRHFQILLRKLQSGGA